VVPGPVRHILDNLLSNALGYRDLAKDESWVRVESRASPASYELRVVDNGVGLLPDCDAQPLELF
jgi:signal transduction histidine kinase